MTAIPDWVIPVAVALLGGGGVGALVTALVNARSSVFTQLHTIITTLQAERVADREKTAALDEKVNGLIVQLSLHREYTTAIHSWSLAGAPPPPPPIPDGLI